MIWVQKSLNFQITASYWLHLGPDVCFDWLCVYQKLLLCISIQLLKDNRWILMEIENKTPSKIGWPFPGLCTLSALSTEIWGHSDILLRHLLLLFLMGKICPLLFHENPPCAHTRTHTHTQSQNQSTAKYRALQFSFTQIKSCLLLSEYHSSDQIRIFAYNYKFIIVPSCFVFKRLTLLTFMLLFRLNILIPTSCCR